MATSSASTQLNSGPTRAAARIAPDPVATQSFLLTRVQPALSGLMDGSLSTLAPIFAVAPGIAADS